MSGKCVRVIVFALCAMAKAGSQQFALHDADRVVFYGDSITAQRLYTRFVEAAILTRYPQLHVEFINAGVPGDTVYGGYAGAMVDRVAHDVAPSQPTMVTVMLGMNDGGYGYTPLPTVHANFIKGYGALLNAIEQAAPKATLTLIQPTPYDEVTHGTEFPGYAAVVDGLAEDVAKITADRAAAGEPVMGSDFHSALSTALQRGRAQFPQLAPLLVPDRIHPGEAAHWIMASALLKTWHFNPVVSRVELDGMKAMLIAGEETAVTKLKPAPRGLEWTQLDEALPLPLDFNNAMTAVLLGVSDIVEIDQQMLQVRGLASGSYSLLIDGKPIVTFSAAELGKGVNLALYKTPMWEQARGIDFLEERRASLDQAKFVLRSEVKTVTLAVAAENSLEQARAEFAKSVRDKLSPKPHTFELRKQ